MAARQNVDISIRKTVIKRHKENMSIRSIAETVKLPKSVVGRIVKCYNDTGRIVSPCKAGRPHKTTN